jgi:DNA topoisomerase VI subunit B
MQRRLVSINYALNVAAKQTEIFLSQRQREREREKKPTSTFYQYLGLLSY